MASRFWVGGSGTWDASSTTHWSATSGGSSGASAPTALDDVTFDASSGLSGSASVTITGTPSRCKTLTIGAITTTVAPFTSSAGGYLEASGNVTIAAGYAGTFAPGNGIFLTIVSACTFTSNGKKNGFIVEMDAAVTLTLGDAFDGDNSLLSDISVGTIATNFSGCSVNFNTKNFTGDIDDRGSTITLSTGTIKIVSRMSISSGSTLNNASTQTFSQSSHPSFYGSFTFAGGGKTYGTLSLPAGTFCTVADDNTFSTLNIASGSTSIQGANSIGTLTVAAGAAVTFASTKTQAITSAFTCTGAGTTTLFSDSPGTAWSLSKIGGSVTISGVTLTDSSATGSASWAATSSVDGGGNSGWIITGSGASAFMAFFAY